jgi:hypothetical protein
MKVSGAAFVQVCAGHLLLVVQFWLDLVGSHSNSCKKYAAAWINGRGRLHTKLMEHFNPQELSSLYCRDRPQLREGFVAPKQRLKEKE